MPRTKTRYDGLADWYDTFSEPHARAYAADLTELLGPAGRRPGQALCLDLCCGTGLNFAAIQAAGRIVVGIDLSADQLRHARQRAGAVLQADAIRLPFADQTFGTVAALWMSTDVDDIGQVLAEAARCMRPGGLLAFYGVHPCFNGPHSELAPDGSVTVHPVYREARWHHDAPWWGENIRRRAGMRHNTLAGLLTAFPAAGLSIERVTEPGDRPVPVSLAIRARRQQT
jgi:ubiquinone/menaquinone biosynthesis C-methylase UbiE